MPLGHACLLELRVVPALPLRPAVECHLPLTAKPLTATITPVTAVTAVTTVAYPEYQPGLLGPVWTADRQVRFLRRRVVLQA